MGSFSIWAIEHDRQKVHDRNVPWQLYQHCVKRAFNKKVRPRDFEEGNLVL